MGKASYIGLPDLLAANDVSLTKAVATLTRKAKKLR